MRYLLNGPINLWDRIGGRKPNRRPLSESRTEQSESFPRCRLGPYCRRYFFSIPPTRKKGHPDVVNLRACVVCGSAEGQHHMRSTARACQSVLYVFIYVTVCIGTVGKLIVNRYRYRRQPCSMSFLYASQHLRRYDVPESAIMIMMGCRNGASLYHIPIHCQVESSRSFHDRCHLQYVLGRPQT
jgi:hypothetical protein